MTESNITVPSVYVCLFVCAHVLRDTAGEEKFFTFTKQFFRGAQVSECVCVGGWVGGWMDVCVCVCVCVSL